MADTVDVNCFYVGEVELDDGAIFMHCPSGASDQRLHVLMTKPLEIVSSPNRVADGSAPGWSNQGWRRVPIPNQPDDLVLYTPTCDPSCAEGPLIAHDLSYRAGLPDLEAGGLYHRWGPQNRGGCECVGDELLECRTPPTTDPGSEVEVQPGAACSLGSHPDCIDPDQHGTGTFLIGGGDCIASFPDDLFPCSDLDGDGHAGYPDSG